MPSTHVIQAGGWWKRRVGTGFGSGDDWWGNASPWIGGVGLRSSVGWTCGGVRGIVSMSDAQIGTSAFLNLRFDLLPSTRCILIADSRDLC